MLSIGSYTSTYEDFFIDEAVLRKIASVILTHSKKLNYETVIIYKLYKSDGTFRNFDSVDEVLTDDNSIKKKVTRLIIELHKKELIDTPNSEEVFVFDLDTEDENRIYFALTEKNRDWAFLFLDELGSQISRIKRGRFWIKAQNRNIQTLIYTAISILVGIVLYKCVPLSFISTIIETPAEEVSNINFNVMKLLLACFSSLFSMLFLTVLMPIQGIGELIGSSTFYWGDEIVRYNRISNIKSRVVWGLIVGFVVSALAGVFVTYFYSGGGA